MAIDPNYPGLPQAPNTIFPYPSGPMPASQYPQGYMTPAQVKSMYDYSNALLKQSGEPVPGTRGGWTVGVQHLVDALVGGKQAYDANRGELGSRTVDSQSLSPEMSIWPTPTNTKQKNTEDASPDKNAALPGDALATLSPEGSGLDSRIIAVEGQGKNPRSSASGTGQFTNGTWIETVKRARPDLAEGKSDRELLTMRSDNNLAREMVTALRTRNSDLLKTGGVEPTDGNVYLAHFLGPTGAKAVIGADPNTSAFDALSASVGRAQAAQMVRANPTILNKSAGEVRAWADKTIGGGGGAQASQYAPSDGGDPSYGADDGRGAIVAALGKGGPGAKVAPVPGVPYERPAPEGAPLQGGGATLGPKVAQAPGPQYGTYAAPFAAPVKPHYSPEQYRAVMGSPWIPTEVKERVHGEYVQQHQPTQVPLFGGNAVIDPSDPSGQRQWFSPGIQKGEETGPRGVKRPVYNAITPRGVPNPGIVHTLEDPEDKANPQAPPPAALPPPIKFSPPISTTPPVSIPAVPPTTVPPGAPAAAPPGAPPVPAPDLNTALPQTNKLAALEGLGVGSDAGSPMASAAAAAAATQPPINAPMVGNLPPRPQPTFDPFGNKVPKDQSRMPAGAPFGVPKPRSESPTDALITNAQAGLGGIGDTAAAAIANGPKFAESSRQWQQRMMDQEVELTRREEDAKKDVDAYNKSAEKYATAQEAANNLLPELKSAAKLVDDPRFLTGVLSDPYLWVQKARAGIDQIRKMFGGTGDKGESDAAAPIEVFQKIMSGAILQELKPLLAGTGQVRVKEIELLTNSVANMYNTPAANRAVLNMMIRLQDQARRVGQIASAYNDGFVWKDDPKTGGVWAQRVGPKTNVGLHQEINNFTQTHPFLSDAEVADIQNTLDIAGKTLGPDGKPQARPNPKVSRDTAYKELSEAAGLPVGSAAAATTTQAPGTAAPGAAAPATDTELPPGWSVK